MSIDLSKSLAELTNTDWGPPPAGASSLIHERHLLHRTPISQLSQEALVRLLRAGINLPILIPAAIMRVEQDQDLQGVLESILEALDYSWEEHHSLVHRVRACIGAVLNDLQQWDGSEESSFAGLQRRCALYRAWAHFELRLSSILPE